MNSKLLAGLPIDPGYILIALCICIIILFILVISLQARYRRLKINYQKFMRGKDGKTLEESILSKCQDIEEAVALTKQNEKNIAEISKSIRGSYQKIGIVRYNAFLEDMEGNLSFALTLLDDNNDGFIFNALHTQNGCYTYVKEIVKGQSYMELSEEESESLDRAIFQEAYGLNFQENRKS